MEIALSSGRIAVRINLSPGTVVHSLCENSGSREPLLAALQNPVGLPQLHECVVPGDRVVIVVDPETPELVSAITLVWEQFQAAGVDELDATLLLPADVHGADWQSLVDELPVHVRNQVAVHVHDPADENQRRYLASSAAGERIYLSHYLTDADLVVTIGVVAFDRLFGCRGTNSAIFPVFSDSETIVSKRRTVGVASKPDEKRPLRELVDEIGWLLGTQFAVQLIPGAGSSATSASCGAPDQVMRSARDVLEQNLRITVEEEIDLAIVTVPGQSIGNWKHLGRALEAAENLVGDGGRIAVIADIVESPGPGIELLHRSNQPSELSKTLERDPTEDAIEVLQIISATVHSRVYLLSQLDASFVEDLGMLPLADQAELQRLTASASSVRVIRNANYAWTQVAVPSES